MTYDLPPNPTIEDLSEATLIALWCQAVGHSDTKGADDIGRAMQEEMKRRSIRPSARSKRQL